MVPWMYIGGGFWLGESVSFFVSILCSATCFGVSVSSSLIKQCANTPNLLFVGMLILVFEGVLSSIPCLIIIGPELDKDVDLLLGAMTRF